jgi:acyl carrier protein
MFDKQSAMTLIQESLDSLFRSKTIKTQLIAKDELILMGSGTKENLDSLGFVNFIMDVEERLEDVIDGEAPITLTDIDGFNVNNPVLTTGVLANHLVHLAN